MHVFEAVRVIALRNVVKENNPDYFMRRVYRWYSKTFHTPLHVVDELPPEFILQHYWEEHFEDMEDMQLVNHVKAATKTEAEKKKEDKDWDAQQAEEVEFAQAIGSSIGKKDAKIKDLKPEPIKPLISEEMAAQQSTLEKQVERLDGSVAEMLNNIKELPPNIHMVFGEIPAADDDYGDDSIPVPKRPK